MFSLRNCADAFYEFGTPGLFDNVLSEYLWARAVMLIGPTVATVGLSMQWPISIAVDMIFKHPRWLSNVSSAVLMVTGALLILFGFFGINLEAAELRSLLRWCGLV